MQAAEASLAEASAKAAEQQAQLSQELADSVHKGEEASNRARELEEEVGRCQARIQEGEGTLKALMANQGDFMDTYAGQTRDHVLVCLGCSPIVPFLVPSCV